MKIGKKHSLSSLNLSISFLCLVGIIPFLSAQSRQDLTEKRENLIGEIAKATELLSTTKKNKAAVLDQFYTVQRQVKQRQELIETLNEEIDLSAKSIERTSQAIAALQDDMQRLENEYSEMARQAYRSNMNDNKLLFLFSADGLSDGLKRWRYLQQYDEYRKKQATLILETRAALTEKLSAMEVKKIEQEDLLAAAEQQQTLLEQEMQIKNKLLKGISASESKISSEIEQKRKTSWKLSQAIEKIISAEINNRVAKNKVNAAPSHSSTANASTKPTSVPDNQETLAIAKSSGDFKKQRGRLPWPVKNGLITRHFGKQSHPIHKKVTISNNGIDIKATVNNDVSTIFSGTVAGLQFVPGYQNTLIIQHGDYYSVYSNLERVSVKKGDFVSLGQLIGHAGKNSQNDYYEVHLEIWQGKQRLNPAKWLAL